MFKTIKNQKPVACLVAAAEQDHQTLTNTKTRRETRSVFWQKCHCAKMETISN